MCSADTLLFSEKASYSVEWMASSKMLWFFIWACGMLSSYQLLGPLYLFELVRRPEYLFSFTNPYLHTHTKLVEKRNNLKYGMDVKKSIWNKFIGNKIRNIYAYIGVVVWTCSFSKIIGSFILVIVATLQEILLSKGPALSPLIAVAMGTMAWTGILLVLN